MSEAARLTIKAMTEADLAEVMALEQENPGPWSRAQLLGELAQATGWQWLAREPASGELKGYIIGRAVGEETEILKLAVAAAFRRRGTAQALLAHAFACLRASGANCCFLELRLSNTAARRLYETNGFTVSGHRKGYYANPTEDAVVMTKPL